MKHLIAAVLVLCSFAASQLAAAPRGYAIDAQGSTVGFAWDFGADEIRGQMPVSSADLSIDFVNLANSSLSVAVDVTGAEAGFPFASQAMKGPKVLDASRYPQITFVSTGVQKTATGATITGDITVRGVTRPMSFAAEIYRQQGTDTTDLTRLAVLLTGALNRSDFGAGGWSDLAGDEVRLRILASIHQVN
jgi:polyisoprenoid-binding protein YceI